MVDDLFFCTTLMKPQMSGNVDTGAEAVSSPIVIFR